LAAGALDEYTGDFLDAWIDDLRGGWDAAVDEEQRHRSSALLRLLGMELHDLTLIQAQVTDLRRAAASLRARVEAWQRVLLGAESLVIQESPVDEAPSAPRAVGLESAIAGSLLIEDDPELTDLEIFRRTTFPQETLR